MTPIEAMKQALNALEESVDLVQNAYDTDWRHGIPTRKAQLDYEKELLDAHKDAITNLRAAIEQMEKAEPVAVADCGVLNWVDGKQCSEELLLYTHPAPEESEGKK